MVLGSEGVWELEERLPGIGWRFAKHYGIVREVANRETKLMMSWVIFIDDKLIWNFSLCQFHHYRHFWVENILTVKSRNARKHSNSFSAYRYVNCATFFATHD
jgi:hypothetical protein